MQSHFFVSDSNDGAIYDTRVADWTSKPLRKNFCMTHGKIESVADFKATLRAGGYAWPGGYPLYFITRDGCAISFEAAKNRLASEIWSIATGANDRIVACEVNYESDLTCEHTNKRIPAAYVSDEDWENKYASEAE